MGSQHSDRVDGSSGLLLEQHQLRPPAAASRAPPQITSKATRPLLATAKNDVVDKGSSAAASFSRSSSSSSSRAPAPTVSPTTACPFLHRCFFCHGELADGRDIYMYRGERAFCSEECRCRHILAEEDDDDTTTSVGVVAAAADCSTQLRHQALAASFTF
uniref:FLZ-type domain-containing protein n=1 Tax=Zea mays TaxID=4577 RepID=A0A804NJM8_MAIZE